MYVSTYVFMYPSMHACMYECMLACKQICMHVCKNLCRDVCRQAGMIGFITLQQSAPSQMTWMYAKLYAKLYVCMCRCIYVCMYVCICTYVCANLDQCMHLNMHNTYVPWISARSCHGRIFFWGCLLFADMSSPSSQLIIFSPQILSLYTIT